MDYKILRALVLPFVRETRASLLLLCAGVLAGGATAASHVSTAWMVGLFIDAAPRGDRRTLAIAAAGLFGAAVLVSTGNGLRALTGRRLTDLFRAHLRFKLMRHVLTMPLSAVESRDSRQLNSVFIDDVEAIATLANPLALNVSMAIIQLTVTLTILILQYPTFIWLVLLIAPINACVGLWQMPRLKASGREEMAEKTRMDNFAIEMLEALRELKGLSVNASVLGRLSDITRQSIAIRWRAAMIGSVDHVRYSGSWLLISIVYFIGGLAVARGDITIGSLTAFIFYLGYLETPINRLWGASTEWQRIRASLGRYANTLSVPAEADGAIVLQPGTTPDIELRNVGFSYGGASRRALDGVSLRFRAGQRIAVVGSSGAGKTTLVSLLLRLFEPEEGEILIGGVDIRRYTLASLRSYVAVISQEPFIFDGTVRDNIRVGLERTVTDSEIEAAARIANADGFIREMPEGYDSLLGTRGARLSGGQKRRLAIARAIIRRPRILILDEITGALDSVSDIAIQRALAEMRDACTTITISHRLSSTASSETIVVLDDGRVVGVGNHRTVMQECSLYRTLAELQDLEQMVEGVDRVGSVLTHPPVRDARVSMAAR